MRLRGSKLNLRKAFRRGRPGRKHHPHSPVPSVFDSTIFWNSARISRAVLRQVADHPRVLQELLEIAHDQDQVQHVPAVGLLDPIGDPGSRFSISRSIRDMSSGLRPRTSLGLSGSSNCSWGVAASRHWA